MHPKIIKADQAVLRNICDYHGPWFVLQQVANYINSGKPFARLTDEEKQRVRDSYVEDLRAMLNDVDE